MPITKVIDVSETEEQVPNARDDDYNVLCIFPSRITNATTAVGFAGLNAFRVINGATTALGCTGAASACNV